MFLVRHVPGADGIISARRVGGTALGGTTVASFGIETHWQLIDLVWL
jgi:hypothetical protein